jgi:hypothetical protein
MVCMIVFQAGNGDYGVMPTDEYDGDLALVVHDYDPWQIMDSDD